MSREYEDHDPNCGETITCAYDEIYEEGFKQGLIQGRASVLKECRVDNLYSIEELTRLVFAWIKNAWDFGHPKGCQCHPCTFSRRIITDLKRRDWNQIQWRRSDIETEDETDLEYVQLELFHSLDNPVPKKCEE